MQKGIGAIVVVLIGLLGWTGCGGDSSSLSKAEYQQKLELVCNKGLQEREEFLAKGNEEAAEGKIHMSKADAIRKLFTVYQKTTEKIAELGLPEKNEKKAEELVQAREAGVAKVNADPLGTISNTLPLFAKARKLAEELEVGSCAK